MSLLNIFYRLLPDFKGKQRLGRLIFRKQIKTISNITVKGRHNIVYRLPNLKENIGYEIFINGIYEKETSSFIISKIPDGGIYIDIGANIGSIMLPVVKNKTNIKIICIEASRSVYSYLEENCRLNKLENIVLINRAISDKDNMVMNFYSPTGQFGKGHFSNEVNEEIDRIITIRLDTLLEKYTIAKPDFIKVDIEGYEYFAFKSAGNLLEDYSAPDFLFEFEDWAEGRVAGLKPGDAQSYLLEKGYKLFVLKRKRVERIKTPKLTGSAMIWATKK